MPRLPLARRSRSAFIALDHQKGRIMFAKRERWTEAELDALPAGEHDFFERKSGQLFSNRGEFFHTVAKAISAFANSGGGSLILGVQDTGTPDGLPLDEGRTPIREWLEQKIPQLVEYLSGAPMGRKG